MCLCENNIITVDKTRKWATVYGLFKKKVLGGNSIPAPVSLMRSDLFKESHPGPDLTLAENMAKNETKRQREYLNYYFNKGVQ